MTCDDAFDLLTSAETCDAERGDLDRHLARCPSCCELAAAVRPAVALLAHSAVNGDHHAGPAGPRLAGPWLASPVVRPHVLAPATPRRRWFSAFWPTAAAALLGVALGGLAQQWFSEGRPPGESAALAGPGSPIELTLKTDRLEGRLRLTSACLDEGAPDVNALALNDLACCTRCHHARASGLPAAAVVEVASSCRFCHLP
jgi:hypothetical protein